MGAIVTMPAHTIPEGITKYLLIDGQQPLTTILILMIALRNKAKDIAGNLSAKIHDHFLTNKFNEDEDFFKLLPTQVDRESFIELIQNKETPTKNKIKEAYLFFSRKIADTTKEDLEKFFRTVTTRLLFVSIVLEGSDNPYLIFGSSGFLVGAFLHFWQHAAQDFEPKVLLIAESESSPLDGTDLVVDPFHESQRHFVLFVAVGLDAVPMGDDHLGKSLEWIQPLPAQGLPPLEEETPGPKRAVVVPQLSERLLEEVGLVQPSVGLEQQLECRPAVGREVLPARQQCVPLPFDEPPVRTRQASVFPLARPCPSLRRDASGCGTCRTGSSPAGHSLS